MKAGKLVVLGSINADHILNINHLPQPGETVVGKQYTVVFGGKGANQAVAAGRSGADISFIACVGDDDIGELICKQLVSDCVDTQSIEAVKNTTTGVALIFVNMKGENVIGINAGANKAVTSEYLDRHKQQVIDASALLMQLESPLETVITAAKIAKDSGTQVILNPAPACEVPDELLARVDIITPNENEAKKLTGIAVDSNKGAACAAQALHDKGVMTVIITLGSRGVWLSQGGEGGLISGFCVKAVDTIAAGDTFNGALITALLEGKSMDNSVRFAHAAAAIAVTRSGAQSSVPWRKEIDDFLAQQEV